MQNNFNENLKNNFVCLNEQSACDYETDFMQNYMKMIAQNKIDSIEEKLATTTNPQTKIKYKEEIQKIKEMLEKELESLFNTDSKQVNSMALTAKNDLKNDIIYKAFDIDKDIYNYLFDYQKEGLKWMLDLTISGAGGILADEMGLGKTVQFIAFVDTLCRNNISKRVLILSPATVVHQWIEEFRKITKLRIKNDIEKEPGVFILGYDQYKVKCKKYIATKKYSLTNYKLNFDIVALDEGHKIKNDDTQIAKLVKHIKSPVKYVISGTPIQNNLTELWSIFNFVNPKLLGSERDFTEEFVENIKGNNEKSYKYSVLLRSILEPFILRRLKSDYKRTLPKKIDKIIFTTLTDIQNKLYLEAIEQVQIRDVKLKNMSKKDTSLLKDIDRLRKVCNHPYLVSGPKYFDIIESSCKMKVLIGLFQKWKMNSDKVLVFTQTVQMQKIIEDAINKFNCENEIYLSFSKMSGSTPIAKRHGLIDDFNADKRIFCFLLTTKVGGLGLNLTGANRIVIYDPDWNPSVDNQAKERIYRHGQNSNVEIYRIICRNTVEEKIYQKQIYKDCLSKKILKNPNTFIQKDMIGLFSYWTPLKKDPVIEEDKIQYDIDQEPMEEKRCGVDLVEVAEEDLKTFEMVKEGRSKVGMTGIELIKFIKMRERSLQK